jgi:hypothetical protein
LIPGGSGYFTCIQNMKYEIMKYDIYVIPNYC